jgi:protocatechuate 3,4-dioxygenase beta subunit
MKNRTIFAFVCCLLAIQFVSARQITRQEKSSEKAYGSISGRITIEGKPAAGFELELRSIVRGDVSDSVTGRLKTDKDGQYKFAGLKSSYYRLQVFTEEYINTKGIHGDRKDAKAGRITLVTDDIPGDMEFAKAGRIISVTGREAVTDANVDLTLGGTVSGRIVDVDGKPIANEDVFIRVPHERASYEDEDDLKLGFFSHSKTDGNGLYKFKGLLPGRYIISMGVNVAAATEKPRNSSFHIDGSGPDGRVEGRQYFEETFYPGVTDKNKAVYIETDLGKEVKDIDYKTVGRAMKAYSASGQVIDRKTGKPVKNCDLWVGYKYEGGSQATGKKDKTDENGRFKIDGLLSGKFFVTAYLEDEADYYSEIVPYEIKNADVSGLKVHLNPGLTIRGKVVIEGAPNPFATAKLSQIMFEVMPSRYDDGETSFEKDFAVNRDGSFKMVGVVPEKLNISLIGADGAFSIVKIENPNGRPVQKPKSGEGEAGSFFNPFVLTLDKNLTDVRIVVRYKNVSTIKGQVNVIGGKLPANLHLRVSYFSKSDRNAVGSSMSVDADGSFASSYLEPGEYQVQLMVDNKLYQEPKIIKVTANSKIKVPFDLDLSTLKKTN